MKAAAEAVNATSGQGPDALGTVDNTMWQLRRYSNQVLTPKGESRAQTNLNILFTHSLVFIIWQNIHLKTFWDGGRDMLSTAQKGMSNHRLYPRNSDWKLVAYLIEKQIEVTKSNGKERIRQVIQSYCTRLWPLKDRPYQINICQMTAILLYHAVVL